jgi:hypothetical protein
MCAPPSDQAIPNPIFPTEEEEDEVSHFPFQDFGNTLFYDSESEGEMESWGKIDPPCCKVEDVEASHEDKIMMHALPLDEVIQILEAPAQAELNMVSCFPFQDFDDALFYDLENEEVLEEPLDVLSPSCYNKGNDFVNNIDEFIHVGKRKWDVIGYDGDPIYDIERHFQKLPLQLSYEDTTNFDMWQQGDDMVAGDFQVPKGDLALCSQDDFRSYLEDFDEYSSEHLNLFHEEDYQPLLCSDLGKGEDVACLKQGTNDKVFQPPLITLPHYVTKHVPCLEFSLGQSLLLEFKGRLKTLRRSLLSHYFSLPLGNFWSSFRFLLVPSWTSDCEDIQGSQPLDSLSRSIEPLIFHDPFPRWIEQFPKGVTWHDFVPPSRLHELDFTISDDTIHFPTHVVFVLDLSLFWFMMKHRGRYYDTLLGWFHWLFDYT